LNDGAVFSSSDEEDRLRLVLVVLMLVVVLVLVVLVDLTCEAEGLQHPTDEDTNAKDSTLMKMLNVRRARILRGRITVFFIVCL